MGASASFSPPPPPPPPAPPISLNGELDLQASVSDNLSVNSFSQNASGTTTPVPPFLSVANRKMSSFQSKQKLKFVEWEKMHYNNINSTVWNDLGTDTIGDNIESLDQMVELQLAQAGVFENIEQLFAQKPTVKLEMNRPTQRVNILDTKKAYNLSKLNDNYIYNINTLNISFIYMPFFLFYFLFYRYIYYKYN